MTSPLAETALSMHLAWRNVVRYARRSVITALTIGLGMIMLILMVGIAEGSYRRAIDTAARSGPGHVTVRPQHFDPFDPQPIADVDPVLAAARAIPGAHVAPRVQALVYLTTAGGAANVLALGVDPGVEREASLLAESMTDGAWLPDTPARVPLALIGRATARRVGASIGDRMVLMVQADGEVRSALVRVGGVFATGADEVDAGVVLVHAETLRSMLGQPTAVHEVAIVLEDLNDADDVQATLQAALPDVDVLTWDRVLPQLGDFVKLDRAGGDVTFLLLFAIVALAVLNAVLMSVAERVKELGLMLGLGTRPRVLFAMVVLESLILSVGSAIIGSGIGAAIVLYLGQTGVDLMALAGIDTAVDVAGYDISGVIYPYLPARRTLLDVLLVIGLTVAGALYPAWRATRIQPVDAIRTA